MSSFDILLIAISIAILSPFIIILLRILGLAILFILTVTAAIAIVIWENICRLFKSIKRLIK